MVVVDTAPTGHTLLLFSFLDTAGAYHGQLTRQATAGWGRVRTPLMMLQDPGRLSSALVRQRHARKQRHVLTAPRTESPLTTMPLPPCSHCRCGNARPGASILPVSACLRRVRARKARRRQNRENSPAPEPGLRSRRKTRSQIARLAQTDEPGLRGVLIISGVQMRFAGRAVEQVGQSGIVSIALGY